MIGDLTPLQEERRKKILMTASEHFADVHFHEADMEKIARHAGVGKGTIYRYFKNKEDLYLRTIEYELDLAMQYIHNHAAEAGNAVDYIKSIISSAVDYFIEHPRSFDIVLLSNMARIEDVVKTVTGIRKKYHISFSVRLQEAVHAGRFRELNSEIAMRILDASIIHPMYDHLKNQSFTREEIVQTLQLIYLNGILKDNE